jgi:peptidoglycan/LPS O-acetylase OafA/YrhL
LASAITAGAELRVLESARTSTARFYHPELDVLRFFAFLIVFLHHAFPHEPGFWVTLGLPLFLARIAAGIGAAGAFGVGVFFVLSSYLITELLLREKDLRGTLDLRSFYIRRVLRIWPLYFAFLALAVVLRWIVPGQQVTWRAGLWFSLLAGNWFIVFHGFPSSVIFPLWRLHRGAVLHHLAGCGSKGQRFGNADHRRPAAGASGRNPRLPGITPHCGKRRLV